MAGYIGSKTSVTVISPQTDSRYVNVTGDTMTTDGATVLTVDRATSDGTIIDLQKNGSSVGTIQTAGGELTVATSGPAVQFQNNTAGLNFNGNDFHPFGADDGLISFGTSTRRFKDLYLSGGVYLGGTGAANYLDDYEEGTWTPAIEGTSTAGSYANIYAAQGIYQKVGSYVTATLIFAADGGTGSGNIRISNYPFSANEDGSGVLQYNSGLDLPTGTNTPVAIIFASGNYALVRCNNDGTGSYVFMPYPANPNYIRLTITYRTAA